jgi:hypothetical protein
MSQKSGGGGQTSPGQGSTQPAEPGSHGARQPGAPGVHSTGGRVVPEGLPGGVVDPGVGVVVEGGVEVDGGTVVEVVEQSTSTPQLIRTSSQTAYWYSL